MERNLHEVITMDKPTVKAVCVNCKRNIKHFLMYEKPRMLSVLCPECDTQFAIIKGCNDYEIIE